jgi:hypothetical protein
MVMLGLAAASAAAGAAQAHQTSKNNQNQANFQAKVARNNQVAAMQNAEEIKRQGKEAENQHMRDVERVKAQQVLSLIAGGEDASTGSAAGILMETAELGQLDALNIRRNAELQARNQIIAGQGAQNQASLFQSSANNQNPMFAGISTGLQGVGQVASTWYSIPNAGA